MDHLHPTTADYAASEAATARREIAELKADLDVLAARSGIAVSRVHHGCKQEHEAFDDMLAELYANIYRQMWKELHLGAND